MRKFKWMTDWWRHLREHLGRIATNYFYVSMGGTFIQSYSWSLFFQPQVLLFLDLLGLARLIVFPEISAIVGKAKAG